MVVVVGDVDAVGVGAGVDGGAAALSTSAAGPPHAVVAMLVASIVRPTASVLAELNRPDMPAPPDSPTTLGRLLRTVVQQEHFGVGVWHHVFITAEIRVHRVARHRW